MQLGTLVLAGVCGVAGLVAGRTTRPTAAAPAPIVVVPVAVARAVEPPRLPASTDPEPPEGRDDGDDGIDVGEAIANANQLAGRQLHERNAIAGHLTSSQTGEAIPGATVIVESADGLALTAVTDSAGGYEITGLATGSYTMTVHYGDAQVETTGVAATSLAVTTQDLSFDPYPSRELDQIDRDSITLPTQRIFGRIQNGPVDPRDDSM